ncbi:hypothetical protein [uncultured Kordia sp.]|uniref:hypothetical protein n=1 Tax=uncultured Kordia sp. TaxID=507699 RepID=UPI00262B6966|nr:hypothetical protein [uncultured Kordia sp.]
MLEKFKNFEIEKPQNVYGGITDPEHNEEESSNTDYHEKSANWSTYITDPEHNEEQSQNNS